MSNLRKNQIKSVIYHASVAVITCFFMMSKYIYEVMPNSVAFFLLLFISLGTTLNYSEEPYERSASVGLPMLINTGLFFVGLIGAKGFINENLGEASIYWVPIHMLNPNLTFMPYFIEEANVLVKYFIIIVTPSFLLYTGMILGNKMRKILYKKVNNLNFHSAKKWK